MIKIILKFIGFIPWGKIFTKDKLSGLLSGIWKVFSAVFGFMFSKKGLITICVVSVLSIAFQFGKWWDSKKHKRIVSELDKRLSVLNLKFEALQHDTMTNHQEIVYWIDIHKKHQVNTGVLRDSIIGLNRSLNDCKSTLQHGLDYGIIKIEEKQNVFQRIFKKKK